VAVNEACSVSLKEWIALIGVGLILLVAFAEMTGPPKPYVKRADQLAGIHTGYVIAIMDWICIVNFFEWRRGLADLGLPEAVSWVLGPVGLILVIACSIASWNTVYGEHLSIGRRRITDQSRWKWIGLPLLWLTALTGYSVVVAGQLS
jgi:hypothetical protein